MESKNCFKCGCEFFKKQNVSKKNWAISKFCSRDCAFDNFQTKGVLKTRGMKMTEEQKASMPHLLQKGHTKVGTENLKKWRENGGTPWNKGKYGHHIHGGSKSPFKKAIRGCQKYINWRTNIMKRDNYTCVECGRRRKKGDRVITEVDHIIPFSQILIDYKIETLESAYSTDILWDESNGRTLCKECHINTESHGSNQWRR